MQVREYPQLKLRLRPELKEKIEQAAKASNRTLNSEACYQLEKAYGLKAGVQEAA